VICLQFEWGKQAAITKRAKEVKNEQEGRKGRKNLYRLSWILRPEGNRP